MAGISDFDGDMVITRYENLAEMTAMTRGGYGCVIFRAQHRKWGVVAYKELEMKFMNDRNRSKLMYEVSALNVLDNLHIVRVFGMVCQPQHYGMIFEFMENGKMDEYLEKTNPDWKQKLYMIHDVAQGMQYLHHQDPPIIHRELKISNIFISKNLEAKVAGFGSPEFRNMSQSASRETGKSNGGVAHIPPEHWTNLHFPKTEPFDVYGFSILMFEAMTQKQPYAGELPQVISVHVANGVRPNVDFIPCDVSQQAKEIMKRCWNQNPQDRPTFDVIEKELHNEMTRNTKLSKRNIDKSSDKIQSPSVVIPAFGKIQRVLSRKKNVSLSEANSTESLTLPNVTEPVKENVQSTLKDNLDQALENYMESCTCSVCLYIFKDPRVLPCGHSFCLDCLNRVSDQLSAKLFKCPACRYEIDVSSGVDSSLKKNFTLQDLIEKMQATFPFQELEASAKPLKKKAAEFTTDDCPKMRNLIKLKSLKIKPADRISGVAIIKNIIYVASEYSNKLRRFQKPNFKKMPSTHLHEILSAYDVTSSDRSDDLFILSPTPNRIHPYSIWKYNTSNNRIIEWMNCTGTIKTISLSPSGDILQLREGDKCFFLNKYTSVGSSSKEIQSIKLSVQIKCPTHAIQIEASGHYVISYGTGELNENGRYSDWKISHVCQEGLIVRTFASVTLSGPLYHLCPGISGGVFVSEGGSKKVISLDSQLSSNVQHFGKPEDGLDPWKLCSSGELIVIGYAGKCVDVFSWQ